MSVKFYHDSKELSVGQDIRVEVELGDGYVALLILTHEGLITDIFRNGKEIATSSQTYDEMAERCY